MYAHMLVPIMTKLHDDGLDNVDDENESTFAVRTQAVEVSSCDAKIFNM